MPLLLRDQIPAAPRVRFAQPKRAGSLCSHCGSAVTESRRDAFCCSGCAAASALIKDLGLGAYYQLDRAPGTPGFTATGTPSALEARARSDVYDGEAFSAELTEAAAGGQRRVRLQLSGIHCFACVWLCENVIRRIDPEAAAHVHLETGVATIDFQPARRRLGRMVAALEQLGYRASPVAPGAASSGHDELVRLGVAMFAMVNTMSFAVASYVAGGDGVSPDLDRIFRWAGAAFATAAIGFAAAPMFRVAAKAVQQRRIVLDQPLLLAILAAYALSMVNAVRGVGPVYFDSVTAVLALVLVGRHFQRRILARAEASVAGHFGVDAVIALKIGKDGAPSHVAAATLARGDVYRVSAGGLLHADGVVVSGQGEVSVESLTGEPTPVPVTVGSRVRAGALNRGAVLEIRAERDAVECYAQRARTLTRKMMARKGSIGTLSDRLSGYFLGLTLAVAALAFYLGLATSIEEAVTRAVAALLVTCPCVFGYAAPLAFARGASQAAGKGVVFKSERALELLAKARTFLFDKTGTLTLGDPRVVAADVDDAALAAAGVPRETLLAVLSQLGDLSHHHIPQALAGWAEQQAGGPRFASLDEVTESTGQGLSFSAAGRRWRVGKPGFAGQASAASRTNVTVEGSVVASYAVDDVVRGEARAVLTALKRAGMSLKIVSGDASSRVHQAAKQLGLLTREAVGGRSAAGKALLVETLERAASERSAVGEGTEPLVPIVMVGNGTNDSLAMATADVGIAVASAGPAAQEAAEIVLTKPGVAPLLDALAQSRGAVGAMRRAFAFAALYNVGAMTLAAHGDVSPVVAALLMPFNSLVVTALVTRWSAPELSPIGEDDA